MMNIKIEKATELKEKPEDSELLFGTQFSDHMFVMDYEEGKGWHNHRIVPYGPLTMEPSAMVFHYGQEMFEGLKAYKTEDKRVVLFRPNKNAERTNKTNDRICIPRIDEEDMVEAIRQLVDIDRDWVPETEGTTLYIRPFIIATDPFLGVRAAHTYKFIIITCPVGAYYKEGLNPVKIWVETKYVRAARGGIGEAKAGGNYVASLKAQVEAKEKGFTQVLWLDSVERKYVEEVGTMNIFFKINGEVITPELNGSILPGITRLSVIELLNSWGINVTERKISIDEVVEASKNGELEEVFGTGTAAVISPVGELQYKDGKHVVNNGKIGELSQRLYDTITGLQTGKIKDENNWIVEV